MPFTTSTRWRPKRTLPKTPQRSIEAIPNAVIRRAVLRLVPWPSAAKNDMILEANRSENRTISAATTSMSNNVVETS